MYSHVHNTYVIKTSISTSCIPQNNMNVLITYIIYMWTHIASSNLNPRRSAHADFCIRENESRMQIWMSHERICEWFTNECVTICGHADFCTRGNESRMQIWMSHDEYVWMTHERMIESIYYWIHVHDCKQRVEKVGKLTRIHTREVDIHRYSDEMLLRIHTL